MAPSDYTIGERGSTYVVVDLHSTPSVDLANEIGNAEFGLVPIIISGGEIKPLLQNFGDAQFALVDKNFFVVHQKKTKHASSRDDAIEAAKGFINE